MKTLMQAIEDAKTECAKLFSIENGILKVNYEVTTSDFGFCKFSIDRTGRLVK